MPKIYYLEMDVAAVHTMRARRLSFFISTIFCFGFFFRSTFFLEFVCLLLHLSHHFLADTESKDEQKEKKHAHKHSHPEQI